MGFGASLKKAVSNITQHPAQSVATAALAVPVLGVKSTQAALKSSVGQKVVSTVTDLKGQVSSIAAKNPALAGAAGSILDGFIPGASSILSGFETAAGTTPGGSAGSNPVALAPTGADQASKLPVWVIPAAVGVLVLVLLLRKK